MPLHIYPSENRLGLGWGVRIVEGAKGRIVAWKEPLNVGEYSRLTEPFKLSMEPISSRKQSGPLKMQKFIGGKRFNPGIQPALPSLFSV